MGVSEPLVCATAVDRRLIKKLIAYSALASSSVPTNLRGRTGLTGDAPA
jgi:hypothetical protein